MNLLQTWRQRIRISIQGKENERKERSVYGCTNTLSGYGADGGTAVILFTLYRPAASCIYFRFSAGSGAAQEDIFQRRIRTLFKSCLFVAGISTCFIILGFGAGALGSIIGSSFFMIAIGLIVIVLGLHQTGLIHIKWLSYEKKVNLKRSHRSDYFGVFLLGLTFSFGWTPCIGPVLGAILVLSATSSRPFYGGFLMAVYSLGFLIPFLILALFSDVLLQRIKKLNKHLGKIKAAGGIVIIMMGILLMTDNLDKILMLIN